VDYGDLDYDQQADPAGFGPAQGAPGSSNPGAMSGTAGGAAEEFFGLFCIISLAIIINIQEDSGRFKIFLQYTGCILYDLPGKKKAPRRTRG